MTTRGYAARRARARLFESFDHGVGPRRARHDVTRGNPAGQPVVFEQSAQLIGNRHLSSQGRGSTWAHAPARAAAPERGQDQAAQAAWSPTGLVLDSIVIPRLASRSVGRTRAARGRGCV